jgi:hypothetical protein
LITKKPHLFFSQCKHERSPHSSIHQALQSLQTSCTVLWVQQQHGLHETDDCNNFFFFFPAFLFFRLGFFCSEWGRSAKCKFSLIIYYKGLAMLLLVFSLLLSLCVGCSSNADCGSLDYTQPGRCVFGICQCGVGYSGNRLVILLCSLTCQPAPVPDSITFLNEPNVTVTAAGGNLVFDVSLAPFLKQTHVVFESCERNLLSPDARGAWAC